MKKILLIEDDQVMRENTAEILELAGFKVQTAENGEEGCAKAKDIKPDLIICDIMMPKLDGYGVLNRLAKSPATSTIPFIFLTAKAEKSDLRRGMELGADDYLMKPYDDEELLSAIDTRMKKQQALRDFYSNSHANVKDFLAEVDDKLNLSEKAREFGASKIKKKQILFNEGDTPQYVFFVISGKLKVFKSHNDGKEYIVEIIEKNEFCGTTSLLRGEAYLSNCLALEDSEIAKLPREDFLKLILANRAISGQFIKLLANQVESKEEQLLSFAYDTVRLRIAKALIDLREKSNSDILKVTRDDLASLAGTTTETVIRCLSDFKKDGLIEPIGRQIKIIDVQALSQQDY